MKHRAKDLIGLTMHAIDGEFGKVDDFYFDDQTWTIRYFIVKTGGWLSDRKVLISPYAFEKPDWDNKTIPVNLTKEQIKNSPHIDTQQTVSRQQEMELYNHYAWPYTGIAGLGFYGGVGMMGMTDSRTPFDEIITKQNEVENSAEPNLRSVNEIKGYNLHALDAEIGDVKDFIINDTNWTISFLVADTGNWLPGKKVIIAPKWVKDFDWANTAAVIDLTEEQIKNSPEYDADTAIPDSYFEDIYKYYGKEWHK